MDIKNKMRTETRKDRAAKDCKRKSTGSKMSQRWSLWTLLLCIATLWHGVLAQCPWQRAVPELQAACLCAYNLGHELSVQCDQVDFPVLVKALDTYAKSTPLDLLYINNSTIGRLGDEIFINLRIHNVQMSGCKVKSLAPGTFRGQEDTMKNLNLQDNELTEVPVDSLRGLSNLVLLDLSKNRITKIQDGSFSTLKKLATLKLSDNNVTMTPGSLRGLEGSLKNLNLKGTKQKRVPECVRGLKTLAFLDLSQNSLRELPGSGGIRTFDGLDALTALNLERNLIQNLGDTAFSGVRRTLSSLSLLNNLLPDFPAGAIGTLSELRVLDIGFNLLTSLPENSFAKNPSITLLALDGNPLNTVPQAALTHLNSTLRGLSLGGRFLHCDCKLRWVTEWIRNGDLQVTSRERNPQFCGSPPRFRDRGFYSIQPEELTCTGENDVIGVATVIQEDNATQGGNRKPSSTTKATTTTLKTTASTTTTSTTTSTTETPSTAKTSTTILSSSTTKGTTKIPPTGNAILTRSTLSPWRHNPNSQQQRPPLILGFPPQRSKADDSDEVVVKNAYRLDNSVIIQWDSDTANILGFRVVYRLFGDKSFKQGPPLEASEREFKIKNVPSQECIVVCVISLEEINVSPETVPYTQCREVRTVSSVTSNMDKITIAASAAICGTIVIAVIVFVAASRRRSRKMHDLQRQQLGGKAGLPIGGLPVNCCAGIGTPSPGGPLSSLATLSAFNKHQDWDQVSAYSGRSIPRPRMYPLDGPALLADDMRSHASHFSSAPPKQGKTRSIADGQSQHSFSNHSGRYLANSAFPSNLVSSRSDLRQSRQSLAGASDRMSRMSFPGTHAHAHAHHAASVASSTRRARPRSRSRDQSAARPGSRYSGAGSTHTLNNYCGDTSDNWTDHDMDIYMARNPTTRGGLVPL